MSAHEQRLYRGSGDVYAQGITRQGWCARWAAMTSMTQGQAGVVFEHYLATGILVETPATPSRPGTPLARTLQPTPPSTTPSNPSIPAVRPQLGYVRAVPTDEQARLARLSALAGRGDMVLAWVSQADIYGLAIAGVVDLEEEVQPIPDHPIPDHPIPDQAGQPQP